MGTQTYDGYLQMDYFGDVSGHFKGLLNGNCEVVVVGVIRGNNTAAGRCSKRAVGRIDDIPEARWNDMMETQKRRFMDCLGNEDDLGFGYASFTSDFLHSMENAFLLYKDIQADPAWDLALTGFAYGEIMFELGARDDIRHPEIEFDRVASTPQCESVREKIRSFVPDARASYEGSRQRRGIQTADCLAGAVAEDHKHGTDWLDYLPTNQVAECRYNSLIQLEHFLDEQSTGP